MTSKNYDFRFVSLLSQRRALLKNNSGDFFVASFSVVNGLPEVLVFPANNIGESTSSSEVAGGRGYNSLHHFLWENVSR